MSALTQYWVTSAFYLHWISPDQVIYEGEEAYVGCEAVGLEDVSYEWKVSRDGGKTFEEDTLLGNEQVIGGLEANDPETEPYLFRCTVTNGVVPSIHIRYIVSPSRALSQDASNDEGPQERMFLRPG